MANKGGSTVLIMSVKMKIEPYRQVSAVIVGYLVL